MHRIRQPAVAGSFYPADPAALRAEIESFVNAAAPATSAPKALIAPHAGYMYSGPIAGSAYNTLRTCRDTIRSVVLLGLRIGSTSTGSRPAGRSISRRRWVMSPWIRRGSMRWWRALNS